MNDLLEQMVNAKQLSSPDAVILRQNANGSGDDLTEEEVLQWVAEEYALEYTRTLRRRSRPGSPVAVSRAGPAALRHVAVAARRKGREDCGQPPLCDRRA